MADWSFLTNHAQVLVCIAHDPGMRLRDIAAKLGITERTAYGIVTELTAAGYVLKGKDGRRNRYMVQAHLPLRAAVTGERTIGEVLEFLVDTNTPRQAAGDLGRGSARPLGTSFGSATGADPTEPWNTPRILPPSPARASRRHPRLGPERPVLDRGAPPL